MLSDIVKERTASAHAALEKKMVAHIRSINSVDDYTRFLSMLYPFHYGLDQLLHSWPRSFYQHGQTAARSSSIAQDIIDLGHPKPAPGNPDLPLPSVESYARMLGVVYVLEGSSLGGQYISKMIASKLELPVEAGFNFFNPYGAETKVRWEQFKRFLDQPAHVFMEAEAVEGANETFLTYNQWISKHEPVNCG